MKNIYIILTQSGTILSRVIKFATSEAYNHASLCLDDKFEKLYSLEVCIWEQWKSSLGQYFSAPVQAVSLRKGTCPGQREVHHASNPNINYSVILMHTISANDYYHTVEG